MGDGPASIESGWSRQRTKSAGSRARPLRPTTTMVKAESTADCRRVANSEKAMLRKPRIGVAEARTTGRLTRTLVLRNARSGLRLAGGHTLGHNPR